MKLSVRLRIQAYWFALSLAALACSPISQAQSAIQDCGYYKLAPPAFIAQVSELLHAVEERAKRDTAFANLLQREKDVTQQLYASAAIGAVPQCIHDKIGPNVQVRGGDALTKFRSPTSKIQTPGFTVIVRGLPFTLCQSVRLLKNSNRLVNWRRELPNDFGPFGTCVSNPILTAITLGKALPMPNTVYIYQPIRPTPPPIPSRKPPAPIAGMCRVEHPWPDVDDSPCMKTASGTATRAERNACALNVSDVKKAILEIHALSNAGTLEFVGPTKRLALLEQLSRARPIPNDTENVGAARQAVAEHMYATGPTNNLDSKFWGHEQVLYELIAQEIRITGCSKGWAKTTVPNWTSASEAKKQEAIRSIVDAFIDVTGITLRGAKINFLPAPWPAILPKDVVEAAYAPPFSAIYPQYPDQIVMYAQSYHKANIAATPVPFSAALRTTLEELMHARQLELWFDYYIKGKLPETSHACLQAPLFMYNEVYKPQVKTSRNHPLYVNEPVEFHAKKFAAQTATRIQALLGSGCP